ncbi:MAG: ABC transporter substrate-binding protein [Massiliimalia sp.]|jgi:multiple sugar transport system substrate-binding protein
MYRAISVLLSGLLLFSSVSCSGKSASEESKQESSVISQPESSELEVPKEPENPSKVIRLAYGYDGSPQSEAVKNWLEQSAQTWDYNGVTIELMETPFVQEVQTTITDARENGETPPDITTGFSAIYPMWASDSEMHKACYLEIDHYLKDYPEWDDGSLFEGAKTGGQYKGKVYAVPYSMRSYGVLWYHKGILEQAGVDAAAIESWEDVLEVIQAVQNLCPEVLPLYYDDPSGYLFNSILFANGGSLMDENGDYDVDNPQIEDSLRYYQELMDLGLNPGAGKGEYSFADGTLAMALGNSGYIYDYTEQGASPWPEYSEQLGVMAIPARESNESNWSTALGMDCFLVTRESGNPRAAVDFIMHCMKPENYKTVASYVTDAAVSSKAIDTPEYQTIPFQTEITQILAKGNKLNFNFGLEDDAFNRAAGDMVKRVIDSRMAPKDAIEQFREDMALYLKEEKSAKE